MDESCTAFVPAHRHAEYQNGNTCKWGLLWPGYTLQVRPNGAAGIDFTFIMCSAGIQVQASTPSLSQTDVAWSLHGFTEGFCKLLHTDRGKVMSL